MTWIQTSHGRAFDLMHPTPEMVDFGEMAEVLARLPRFTGHVAAGPYSVAQHSVVGADAIYRDTGSIEAAGAFILHDGHEYVLGDKATPMAAAEAETAESLAPGMGRVVLATNRLMKHRVDIAIYLAGGMGANGRPADHQRTVHEYDLRMLRTERDQLLGRAPMPWHDSIELAPPVRLLGKLTVWPWPKAADEFRDRLDRYLPGRIGATPPQRPAPARSARSPLEA